jgi:DNA-directed RNA polymerase subunit H (RpoH/RPB5)
MEKKKFLLETNVVKKVFQSRTILLEILADQGFDTNVYNHFDINQVNDLIKYKQLDMILQKKRMLATTKPSNSAAFTFLQQLHEKATTPPSSTSGADEMEVETQNETNQGTNQEIKVDADDEIVLSSSSAEKIYIHYDLEKSFRISQLETIINELFFWREKDALTTDDTLFIVILDKPNDTLLNELKKVWEVQHLLVEVVCMDDLLMNIFKHVYVHKHTVVKNQQQIQSIMQKFNIRSKDEFPEISRFDKPARLICSRPGDLIEIERPSPTSCVSYYYRLCVNN